MAVEAEVVPVASATILVSATLALVVVQQLGDHALPSKLRN